VHVAVPPHTFPQAPQLFLSVASLTHPPLHVVGVAIAQVGEQAPAEQTSCVAPGGKGSAVQSFPHAPQLPAFDAKLTHRPLHRVCPAAHAQTPAVHCEPPVHALAHRPQFSESICSFTHALLQLVRAGPESVTQFCTHTPLAQSGVGAGQTRPQPPQLEGLVLTLIQAPLHDVSGEHEDASVPTSRAASIGAVSGPASRGPASGCAWSAVASAGTASSAVASTGPPPSPELMMSRSVRPHPAGNNAEATLRENAPRRKRLRAFISTSLSKNVATGAP
jgi:hypothetical protein